MPRRLPDSTPILLASVALLFSVGCGGETSESADSDSHPAAPPTFNRDIAPIVFHHCVSCHRPEKLAPFSLLTYEDVKAWAPRIAEVTADRSMPPWMPEPGYGEFVGDRRLSDDEIALIRRWVEEGAVEGHTEDLPPLPQLTEGWQLGEPDLVIEVPEPYTLRAGGTEEFRNFVIPIPIDAVLYVRTVDLRPRSPKVVHHAVMMIDRTGSSRRFDEEDPESGFDGMLTNRVEAHSPEGFFLGWTPGRVPYAGTEDMAWHLDPGTDIVLQLHLRPSGEEALLQSAVGFYFAERPPTRISTMIRLGSETLDIPAEATDYEIEDSYTLPVDVEVFGSPPAHRTLAGASNCDFGGKRITQQNYKTKGGPDGLRVCHP